jgi:hypothetical protein
MRESTQKFVQGLVVFLVILCVGSYAVHAQLVKELNGAVKTATTPAKDAQKILKGAQKPAKDASKTINTVTKAPKKVEQEYTKVGKEVEKTEQAYKKTGDQAGKAVGIDGKGEHKSTDSTATKADPASTKAVPATEAAKEEAPKRNIPPDFVPEKKVQPVAVTGKKGVDPMDVPNPVPPGSRDHKTASGPLPTSENSKVVASGGTENEGTPNTSPVTDEAGAPTSMSAANGHQADGKTTSSEMSVAASNNGGQTNDAANALNAGAETKAVDPAANPANHSNASNAVSKVSTSPTADNANSAQGAEEPAARLVEVKSVPRSGEKRPKPDYSHSPARVALEKADFDIETLEDLFRYSNWEGPEREHTVRSVAQALDELQSSIVEVKKLDPGQSTWRFEESYKDMKAAYATEMKRGK